MYNLSKYISKARCYAVFCYFMHSCLSAYDYSHSESGRSISTIQKSPLYLAAQLQLHHLSLSIGSNIWSSTKRKPMLWLASFIRAMLPSSMLMNRIYHLLTISNLIASASLAANPPENSMTF